MITLNGLPTLTGIVGLLAITLALANLLALSRMARRLHQQKQRLDTLSEAMRGPAAARLSQRLRAGRADPPAGRRHPPLPLADNER